MAFDIYAGTLVRYYTRDWENVVQRQARIDGTPYTMIYAGGDEGPRLPKKYCRLSTRGKPGSMRAWPSTSWARLNGQKTPVNPTLPIDRRGRAIAAFNCGLRTWKDQ